jgi:predicted ArsR family transcriptional regulator
VRVIETLQYLRKHGQRLDLEIAKEMGVPLVTVRQQLRALADTREAIVCSTIRFENGKKIEAWQARVSGYVPPGAPGRKAKPKGKPTT